MLFIVQNCVYTPCLYERKTTISSWIWSVCFFIPSIFRRTHQMNELITLNFWLWMSTMKRLTTSLTVKLVCSLWSRASLSISHTEWILVWSENRQRVCMWEVLTENRTTRLKIERIGSCRLDDTVEYRVSLNFEWFSINVARLSVHFFQLLTKTICCFNISLLWQSLICLTYKRGTL